MLVAISLLDLYSGSLGRARGTPTDHYCGPSSKFDLNEEAPLTWILSFRPSISFLETQFATLLIRKSHQALWSATRPTSSPTTSLRRWRLSASWECLFQRNMVGQGAT